MANNSLCTLWVQDACAQGYLRCNIVCCTPKVILIAPKSQLGSVRFVILDVRQWRWSSLGFDSARGVMEYVSIWITRTTAMTIRHQLLFARIPPARNRSRGYRKAGARATRTSTLLAACDAPTQARTREGSRWQVSCFGLIGRLSYSFGSRSTELLGCLRFWR